MYFSVSVYTTVMMSNFKRQKKKATSVSWRSWWRSKLLVTPETPWWIFTLNFNYSSVIITICYHLNYRVRLKIISYFAAAGFFLKLLASWLPWWHISSFVTIHAEDTLITEINWIQSCFLFCACVCKYRFIFPGNSTFCCATGWDCSYNQQPTNFKVFHLS